MKPSIMPTTIPVAVKLKMSNNEKATSNASWTRNGKR